MVSAVGLIQCATDALTPRLTSRTRLTCCGFGPLLLMRNTLGFIHDSRYFFATPRAAATPATPATFVVKFTAIWFPGWAMGIIIEALDTLLLLTPNEANDHHLTSPSVVSASPWGRA